MFLYKLITLRLLMYNTQNFLHIRCLSRMNGILFFPATLLLSDKSIFLEECHVV